MRRDSDSFNGRQRSDCNAPSIMVPIDAVDNPGWSSEPKSMTSLLPDVTLTSAEFKSLQLAPGNDADNGKSYLILDDKEKLKVKSSDQFVSQLRCDKACRVKVVSVFGNTGDGKSYTLNRLFFEGEQVFRTSSEQDSCTLGIWAAFDSNLKVICLDTEGLLGSTNHESQRTRLLLKVLAISDIVIYRTRSERLHRDLFTFLGWASRAYTQHFQAALTSVGQRGDFGASLSALGPAVVIFHETNNTKPLAASAVLSAEDVLRERFAQCHLDIEAFSSLHYVGTQSSQGELTDFSGLSDVVRAELKNTTVRSPRQPDVVYTTLKALNEKFSGEIMDQSETLFPDQYFTCSAQCLSCLSRCDNSMGHLSDNKPHSSALKCRYQHQYGNYQYICKVCHKRGKEVIVTEKTTTDQEASWFGLAKYAWSGSVIECSECGEIYRSRQFWFGNKSPEDDAVRTEFLHVWPGSKSLLGSQNAAQKILDGVSYISTAVASVSTPPARAITSWVTDQIAPKYWQPNHQIKECFLCSKALGLDETKHHCRACGMGCCEDCSRNSRPVPDRGWSDPVRVCDQCCATPRDLLDDIDDTEVRVRKYGEVVVNTFSSVAAALEYPRGLLKDSVRPSYWTPDAEVTRCCVCTRDFGPRLLLHHCRDCGQGVCQDCSLGRRQVLERGWDNPVRVCDNCFKQ